MNSRRGFRVLGRVLPGSRAELPKSCPVRTPPIGADLLRSAVAARQFPEELQRGLAVAGLRHDGFQHLSLVVDGAPEIGPLCAAEIRRKRASAMRASPQWRWHLNEVFVKINGLCHQTSADLGNPHGVLTVRVNDETWTVEVGQPWRNAQASLTDEMLAPGTELTAEGHRSADPDQLLMKAERLVIDGRSYIGYMIGPFVHSEYQSVQLASDQLYLVGPRNHELMQKAAVRPADLAGADLILGDMADRAEFRWRLADLFHSNGIPLRVRLEASNTLALIGLVAAGLGVTIYPEGAVRGIRLQKPPSPRLVTRGCKNLCC